MNIRLEYSPTLGQFNQAQATGRPDAGKGFKTLCCFISKDRAIRFVQAVELKFPELASGNGSEFPSLPAMQHELLEFLEEDLKLLNQHMSQTFQRRRELFTKHF